MTLVEAINNLTSSINMVEGYLVVLVLLITINILIKKK